MAMTGGCSSGCPTSLDAVTEAKIGRNGSSVRSGWPSVCSVHTSSSPTGVKSRDHQPRRRRRLRPGAGNELLAGDLADYPRYELRRIAAYQIINVVQVLCRLESSPLTGRPAVEDFAGYLVLDALVANVDRHHENWAVLVARRGARRCVLAPTFDHAASLACGLTDEARIERLRTPGPRVRRRQLRPPREESIR